MMSPVELWVLDWDEYNNNKIIRTLKFSPRQSIPNYPPALIQNNIIITTANSFVSQQMSLRISEI